jgi:hypothetical protein
MSRTHVHDLFRSAESLSDAELQDSITQGLDCVAALCDALGNPNTDTAFAVDLGFLGTIMAVSMRHRVNVLWDRLGGPVAQGGAP